MQREGRRLALEFSPQCDAQRREASKPPAADARQDTSEEHMTDKTHKVEFKAHRTVTEEVPVKFRTQSGKRVSFDAKKKVKEPVRVKFMARDK